jgi:hypothetical protein
MFMRSQFRFFISGIIVLASLGAPLAHAQTVGAPAFAQYSAFEDPGSVAGSAGAGGLVASNPTIDGGTVPMGASAQVVVLFRNEGGQPVETGLIRLYPSSTVSAAITLDQCKEEPLSPGAECAVALTVKALQPGPWRVEMLLSHNGRTRLATATLSGNVEAAEGSADKLASDIETIPDSLDFGSLTSSQTLVEPVILRNITSNEIDISDIYIDTSEQSGYALKTECDKLAAGEACIATITWAPKVKGRSSGVLVVKHAGPTGLSSVPLKGEFTPDKVNAAEAFPQAVPGRGLLVSSQEELDFGVGIDKSSSLTVTLVNSGDSQITLKDIQISGSDSGLGFREGGCGPGTVLEPIEACPLTVTWAPTRVGPLFDDIQVSHDGARGILVLPVRGEATGTVSQDQKAIMLSQSGPVQNEQQSGPNNQPDRSAESASHAGSTMPAISNPGSTLDGFKITSFSPTRAIINGPGGSRLVFDNEETVMGGVPWMVMIQKNGIEFVHKADRILLLFDRSLSSINRVSASSRGGDAATGAPAAIPVASAAAPAAESPPPTAGN